MKKICIFFLSTLALAWFPVSEIAIVSMLFPWHFSGIIWHPGGIPWNAMECHGRYIISMEFYGIQVECHGMLWMLHYFNGISVKFHGISVECHGIPWDTEDWYSDKISEWI